MKNYSKSDLKYIIGRFSTKEAAKKALQLIQKHKPISEHISLKVESYSLDSCVIKTQLAQSFKGAIVGGILFGSFGLTVGLLLLSMGWEQRFFLSKFNPESFTFVSAIALSCCVFGSSLCALVCGLYEVILVQLDNTTISTFTSETSLSNKYVLVVRGSEADVDSATRLLRQST